MEINALPVYDINDNPTGCCPRFRPEPWDGQELHFQDKSFVRAKTRSLFHFPLNMGAVFRRTFAAIKEADAQSDTNFAVLSREETAWSAEHLFAVTRDVPGQQTVRLTGDYVTKVFEGPYRDMPRWCDELEDGVRAGGEEPLLTYFFYTTCPKCARAYGQNYVVGVAQIH